MSVTLDQAPFFNPLLQHLDQPHEAPVLKKVEEINPHHDNLAGKIMDVFSKATTASEERLLELTQKIEESNQKSNELGTIRQKLRLASGTSVDFSQDQEMRTLLDKAKGYGLKLPNDNYIYTKDEIQSIILNTEELSDSLMATNKKDNMKITWMQDINQTLWTMWAKMIEAIGELMKTLARMGR